MNRHGRISVGAAVGLGIAALLIILLVGGCSSVVKVWNTLNGNYQEVNGGKSRYSVALNTIPQKIEGVWTMSQQYMDHESKTFREYAAMRSGLMSAIEAFQKNVEKGGNDSDTIKSAQSLTSLMQDFKKASGLAVNVAIENNPQLRAVETSQQAMRTMEAGVNEIKTAMDDWVTTTIRYNTYRGNAWPSIVGGFMAKFPADIQYYEGEVKKLDIMSLNPANPK